MTELIRLKYCKIIMFANLVNMNTFATDFERRGVKVLCGMWMADCGVKIPIPHLGRSIPQGSIRIW